MVDVELTELQTKLYDAIKENEAISKKNLAKKLDMPLRSISSPVKSMLDSGVIVADEYGDFTIAAGVREEVDDGLLSVPSAAVIDDEPDEYESVAGVTEGEEDDDLYSEYWQKHPEELVTYYQEEGLDALKKHALQSALVNTPGVGQKALNSALHWFDIDEDVRRDPTALMRALEDAGVKHTVVGRVVRETFLPEKQYSRYIKAETDIIIDRGRKPHRKQTSAVSHRRGDAEHDEYYAERYEEPDRYRHAPRNDEEPPWWYHNLMSRIDPSTGGQGNPYGQGSPQPQVVVEPILDSHGNPVPDPNNPGQYMERKLVYDSPAPHAQSQDPYESEHLEQVLQKVDSQSAELARLREMLAETETEKKISSALDPLLSKIANLERTEPARKAGLTDEQYRLQTEKEIVQDMTSSVENTVTTIITPILEGLSELQKATAMRDIIQLEKSDGVDPGMYLKYMMPGRHVEETVTKERVDGTIANIRNMTRGAK